MDRRIERTRRSLREALFALARERTLDEISVTDIAERAGINRSTYYQHYSDKDTLLADALDAQIDAAVGEEMPVLEDGPGILLAYLRHVEENAALYRSLLGESGSATIQIRVQQRMQQMMIIAFEGTDEAVLPRPLAAAAASGSALAMVRTWLELTPVSAPEVAAGWIWTVLDRLGVLTQPDDR